MKINGRVDTILGSTYWENDKIVSRHANAMTRELEQVLKDIDELAAHARRHKADHQEKHKKSETISYLPALGNLALTSGIIKLFGSRLFCLVAIVSEELQIVFKHSQFLRFASVIRTPHTPDADENNIFT